MTYRQSAQTNSTKSSGVFDSIRSRVIKTLKSLRPMSANEWAEEHGYLSAESSADVGRWKSLPYQVEILNAISDENIEGIVVKKSARVGYTKIINHAIGYYIEHKPSSILIVQPTIEDAEGYSKEELTPYIRDVECLSNIVADAKAKDGTNTILHKLFPGGVLSIIGANSPRGFRRISRARIFLDEVSGYPKSAGPEGNPVKLAIRRSEYFADRKIIAGSTPTIEDECEITKLYEDTDQRRYFVPCPHCEEMQFLEFKNLKWPDEDPSEAYFECKHCKEKIEHKHKRSMIERGQWKATAESKNPKWIGFHIWAAYSYSPNSTWGKIALEFLEARRGGVESIQTFVNTVLGEAYSTSFGEKNYAKEFMDRSEGYQLNFAPKQVLFITAAVDTQDNRLAVQTIGWGHDDESWVINYMEIYGNPSENHVWKSLDEYLNTKIQHEIYEDMSIRAVAIDSGGHYTHDVYSYARDRRSKGIFPIKGASQRNKPALGKPTLQDINTRSGRVIKKGILLYPVGTDTIKGTLWSRMKITEPGGKYIHYSSELSEDYFRGLLSERKVAKIKRGKMTVEWVKNSSHVRNESWDTMVYNFAAKEFILAKYPKKLAFKAVEKELVLKKSKEEERLNSSDKPSSNKKKSVWDNYR